MGRNPEGKRVDLDRYETLRNDMSRIDASRKTVGTARRTACKGGCNSYRAGAALLPRAYAPGSRGSGTRGVETPQQPPQGGYIHSLAIQGGGSRRMEGENKGTDGESRSLRNIPRGAPRASR